MKENEVKFISIDNIDYLSYDEIEEAYLLNEFYPLQ